MEEHVKLSPTLYKEEINHSWSADGEETSSSKREQEEECLAYPSLSAVYLVQIWVSVGDGDGKTKIQLLSRSEKSPPGWVWWRQGLLDSPTCLTHWLLLPKRGQILHNEPVQYVPKRAMLIKVCKCLLLLFTSPVWTAEKEQARPFYSISLLSTQNYCSQ